MRIKNMYSGNGDHHNTVTFPVNQNESPFPRVFDDEKRYVCRRFDKRGILICMWTQCDLCNSEVTNSNQFLSVVIFNGSNPRLLFVLPIGLCKEPETLNVIKTSFFLLSNSLLRIRVNYFSEFLAAYVHCSLSYLNNNKFSFHYFKRKGRFTF